MLSAELGQIELWSVFEDCLWLKQKADLIYKIFDKIRLFSVLWSYRKMESVVKCQDLQTVVPEPGFLLHMSNSRAQNHTERIEWKGEFGFDWNQERQGVPKIGKIMVQYFQNLVSLVY